MDNADFDATNIGQIKVYSSKTVSFLRFVLVAVIVIFFATTVLGGILRYYDAGGACLDWPTCLGNWLPPQAALSASVSLDYLHRALSGLGLLMIFLATGVAGLKIKGNPGILRPLIIALALSFSQVILGGILNTGLYQQSQSWLSALHLALSLGMQLVIVQAAMVAFNPPEPTQRKLVFQTPYARLSLVVLVVVNILLASGLLVTRSQAASACSGWSICLPQNIPGWITLGHRLWVGLTGLVLTVLLLKSWRTHRSHAVVLVTATAAFILFWAQALLGSEMVSAPPAYLLVLHQATAVAVWLVLAAHGIAVGLAARTTQDERREALAFNERRGMARDFLSLTKPVVVALLLVTTYAGMVISARAWPSAGLVFWTLLGGFMAAGGSGAINQFIDRKDDSQMQRTQRRPIPAGRLMPAEGLAFGVAMLLASFYLYVAFVNILAALLSLAGMVYYVLIYSILLKKTTVQNIVIGGGAGAIPPLVGWAAATGSLNVPALFLFAVVFMWTPPHFWALALVRRNDYARAGVPMLPVVRGEKETRWQILIYTIELVILTLFLPLFGLGGSVYLVGACVLGLWLGGTAWRVWKVGGNKVAWKMYRYSSMYLAFLFVVMMADALIIIK